MLQEVSSTCRLESFYLLHCALFYWKNHLQSYGYMHALQKQIGWFNHRVVTLVAGKQKRQWLCTVYFADYIRQLERKLPRLSCNQHLAVSNHWTYVQQQPRSCRYTEHLWVSHQLLSTASSLWSVMVVTPSQMFCGLSVVTYDLGSGCLCN